MDMLSLLAALAAHPMTLTLTAPVRYFLTTDPIRFEAKLRNTGKEPLRWVRTTDGEYGKRAPRVMFERKTSEGWKRVGLTVGICGNSNPLTAENFFSVKPEGAYDYFPKDSYWPGTMTDLSSPGAHTVRLVVDTTAPFDEWIGGPVVPEEHERPKRSLQSDFDAVPKVKLVSNEVTIWVRAGAK
jgi:hypothetical protein